MMMHIEEILTPAALIDLGRLKKNIKRMTEFALRNQVSLRPHIKAHKCIEIARLQKEVGIDGITVSTLGEAQTFLKAGFTDITYAVPLAPAKIPRVLDLAKGADLKVLVDNKQVVGPLAEAAKENDVEIKVMLKVDVGYHRCGVIPKERNAIDVAKLIHDSSHLQFIGILTHGGHSYDCQTREDVVKIAIQEQRSMLDFAKVLERANSNLRPEVISVGSTPTMSVIDTLEEGITEIRPGNYVFFDYTQVLLGSCNMTDCALTIIASVIGTYPDRIVIDAGATMLSLDPGPIHIEPDCGFGKIIKDYEGGTLEESAIIASLSQEHGKVQLVEDSDLHSKRIGDFVRVIPNHSCLAANLSERYYVVEEDNVIDEWIVHSRRE